MVPMPSDLHDSPRSATHTRESKETKIEISLTLDGSGQNNIHTGYGMLDHMLDLLAFWGDMDLDINCQGDLQIDAHHLVEDTGLVLGYAFRQALRDVSGIERTGFASVPMDEALAQVSVDISGRPWLVWRGEELLPQIIAREEKDIWREFYKSFVANARINLHICFLYGKNGHHLLESAAKGTGQALGQALRFSGTHIRSTKGGLD